MFKLYFTYLYISIYLNTCILGRTYFVERSIQLIEEHRLLIITGVQASGVITDRLLRQCCFVWSKIIVGPHSLLKLPDECGPSISEHTKQHCRNKRSMITPEA